MRRACDLSQRDMATRAGIPKSTFAAAEAGIRDLGVGALSRVADVAGCRVVVLDGSGAEVVPMAAGAVRDMGNRHFPAHLDTRYGDDDWWHGPERYSRRQPWYTFDLARERRDGRRAAAGSAPDDHQLPQPGDSPEERRAARQRAAQQRAEAERERRRAAGLVPPDPGWVCDCPPECEELEDWEDPPKHAAACICLCDLC